MFVMQISALALDPAGARLVTGSYDYQVKFWDFAGMDAGLRSFRTISPCERQEALTRLLYLIKIHGVYNEH